MGPLYNFGAFTSFWNYFAAVGFGFLFGFILERSGFADSRNITSVFYLRDFRVPKVMFIGILVAMVGTFMMGAMGLLDLGELYIAPTYLLPQAIGGLFFGFGMVIGGFCPGTSMVAAVNLKWDAVVFIVGILAGIVIFGEVFEPLAEFHGSTYMGRITFMHLVDLHPAVFMLAIVLFAVAFIGAGNWLEGVFGKKKEES